MNNFYKKTRIAISVIELILVPVMYFVMDYHFDHDASLSYLLPSTSFEATFYRISIYMIPGLHLISSAFGLSFFTKGILVFGGVLEILAGINTLYYMGQSLFMMIVGIISIILGIIYILVSLLDKEKITFD